MLTPSASFGFTEPRFGMWKAFRHKSTTNEQKVHDNPSSTQVQKEEATKIRKDVWASTKPQAEYDDGIRKAGRQLSGGFAAATTTAVHAPHLLGSFGTTTPVTLGLAAAQYIGTERSTRGTADAIGSMLLRATRSDHVGDFADGLVDMRYDPKNIPHADKLQSKHPDRAVQSYNDYRDNPSGNTYASSYLRAQNDASR